MSAVVTKKPGGDYATQLTFPTVFAQQAKANNLASQYYPDAQSRPMVLPRGSGLQESYHEQKRLDANRRCLAAVRDNAASTARFLSSHANYIVPKPVLSQRKYANPSNGNQADIYSNRPIQWNTMSGGVLRTTEGQEWAIGKLRERIPQLDAIKAAKEAFLMDMPMGPVAAEQVGVSDITAKVELYNLLSRVESDVEQGVVSISNKTVEKSQSVLRLLFAFIPYADTNEVEEVMEKVEYIIGFLSGITLGAQSDVGEDVMKNADYLSNLYELMREYLVRMNGVLGRPRKEREKASAVFIKSLGFSELEKRQPVFSAKEKRAMEAAEAANPNADPDEEEEEEIIGPAAPVVPVFRVGDSLGSLDSFRQFAPPPASRPIDDEKEPEFDDDVRQSDGFKQGNYVGEVPLGKAERSTGSDSAQMIVQEEISEEEIQRRLAMPEAASSVESAPPKVKKEPKRKPSVGARPLTDAERETLEKNTREMSNPVKYRKKLIKAVEDGVISSADFINNLDEVAVWLKANGLTDVTSTGSNLRGYIKSLFGKRVALIEETQQLREKDRVYQQSKQASS
jgi:hypothetical protein